MRGFRRLAVLIAVNFVDMIGFMIVLPLLPFYALKLHATPEAGPIEEQLQLSQLRYITASRAAATSLAENYVGYRPVAAPG